MREKVELDTPSKSNFVFRRFSSSFSNFKSFFTRLFTAASTLLSCFYFQPERRFFLLVLVNIRYISLLHNGLFKQEINQLLFNFILRFSCLSYFL